MTGVKHVFVSYSAEDREWAGKFAEKLSESGLDVWLDGTDREPGDDAAEKALRESDLFVALLSETSVSRPNVLFEIGAALAGGKRLIPVYLSEQPAVRLPFALSKGVTTVPHMSPAEAAKAVAAAL